MAECLIDRPLSEYDNYIQNHDSDSISAFTLIELLIVVAIIGILVAIAVSKLSECADARQDCRSRI